MARLTRWRRKVTRETVEAFLARESKACGNTRSDGDALYLHGNKIAEWRGDEVWITDAGWPSPTTRERLCGIVLVSGDSKVERGDKAPPLMYFPTRGTASGHRVKAHANYGEDCWKSWGGEWVEVHAPGTSYAWAEVQS